MIRGILVAERDAGAPAGVVLALPGARARASAGLRRVRKRPGAAARDVAGRHAAVRGQHAGQPRSRSSTITAAGTRRCRPACRSAWSRSRSRRAATTEVWVVNHLSDSVSIVDVAAARRASTRTLLVGDEPRDIVFAGPAAAAPSSPRRTAASTARDPSIAGVPGAGDPQLTTPGVGRADVWVFDAASLGTTLGGTPLRIVTLLRRHAARARGQPGRQHGLRRRRSSPATRRRRSLEALVCDGFGATAPCSSLADGCRQHARAACPARAPTSKASRRPRSA